MINYKKFTHIKTVKDIEIFSDIGYVPIKNIMKTIPYIVYIVTLANGDIIKVADKHIFIDSNNNEIFCEDLIVGNKLKHKDGLSEVTDIKKTDNLEQMFDLQMAYHHKYYTNDVLSHNTTIASAYILHQTLFNLEYSTALLSYKKALAVEVLDRVRLMYEELPYFLQMGVSVWNRGNIELGNRSKIFSAPATTSSIRGKTVNCVDINTKIKVRNKTTQIVEELTIQELGDKIGLSSVH